MMSKKSPQLRFEGFTDDWEVRKLTDVTYSYSGLTYSPTDVQDKGTFVLRSSNVKNDQLIDADNVYVNPDIVNSNNVKVGDVIVVVRNGSRSLIGKHAIVTKEMPHTVIGAFMSAFRGENGDYINALLSTNNFQKEVHKSLGATINQITGKDFSMMNFLNPKLEEQNKIGSFFKQLDNTIALHQRKLDLLKEQKKGYLQKMFPKNGAKVPELRFAGFADDWEERKLGDEVLIVMGQSPNSENYTDNPNDHILVQGNADMKNGHVFPRVWTTQVTKQAEKNDLILSVRAPVGDIGKTDYDVVIGRGVAAIKGNEFIFQNLGKMKSDGYWTRYSTGSTFESINSSDIKEAIISIPRIEEQQKIGSFFKQLDNTIALHQSKLDLLKQQKKGYLQKMFV